jgi:hypothetical protein
MWQISMALYYEKFFGENGCRNVNKLESLPITVTSTSSNIYVGKSGAYQSGAPL